VGSGKARSGETTDNSRRVAQRRPANFLLSTALSAVGLLIRGSPVQILPGALTCEYELLWLLSGSSTALDLRGIGPPRFQ